MSDGGFGLGASCTLRAISRLGLLDASIVGRVDSRTRLSRVSLVWWVVLMDVDGLAPGGGLLWLTIGQQAGNPSPSQVASLDCLWATYLHFDFSWH